MVSGVVGEGMNMVNTAQRLPGDLGTLVAHI
jgi:hypothetical protein